MLCREILNNFYRNNFRDQNSENYLEKAKKMFENRRIWGDMRKQKLLSIVCLYVCECVCVLEHLLGVRNGDRLEPMAAGSLGMISFWLKRPLTKKRCAWRNYLPADTLKEKPKSSFLYFFITESTCANSRNNYPITSSFLIDWYIPLDFDWPYSFKRIVTTFFCINDIYRYSFQFAVGVLYTPTNQPYYCP